MEAHQIQAIAPIKPETASGVVKITTVSHRGFAANDPSMHRGCSSFSYDAASGGRYTTSDPRGILLDFSEPSRQVAAKMGIAIPRFTSFNGLNHTYGYANQNPLIYTDPTGEFGISSIIKFAVKKFAKTKDDLSCSSADCDEDGIVDNEQGTREPRKPGVPADLPENCWWIFAE